VQLYAAGYFVILVFQKVFRYFLPAPSQGQRGAGLLLAGSFSGDRPIIIVGHLLKYRALPLKYGALTLYLVDLQGLMCYITKIYERNPHKSAAMLVVLSFNLV
jgi:hypothetical protein